MSQHPSVGMLLRGAGWVGVLGPWEVRGQRTVSAVETLGVLELVGPFPEWTPSSWFPGGSCSLLTHTLQCPRKHSFGCLKDVSSDSSEGLCLLPSNGYSLSLSLELMGLPGAF